MENVGQIFRSLVADQRSSLDSWKNEYVKLVSTIQEIRIRLRADKKLNLLNQEVYSGLDIPDYSTLLHSLIYKHSNGISSKGRATIPKVVFDRLEATKDFEGVLKDAFTTDNAIVSYTTFRKWWTTFCRANGSMDFKLLVNRAFSAIHPEISTVTVDEDKFNNVINELGQKCGFRLTDGNWFENNISLTKWLSEELKEELDRLDASYGSDLITRHFFRNVLTWAVYENGASDLFDLYKQVIKYGPPGTGKTYTCQRDAEYHFDNWIDKYNSSHPIEFENHVERIQFHPSFTYEDFIEGLRPVPDSSGKTVLKLVNGIFKSFCKRASLWEREVYEVLPGKRKDWEQILVKDVRGKVKGEHWDFINGLDDKEQLDKVIPPFYFIIDEINRGELSRVFGELMFSLEYRGYKGKIKTQYSQLANVADSEYWKEGGQNYFFIPHNLFLFGTMNTIDRSVESFDFALRRRFRWQEILPDYSIAKLFLKENGCDKFAPAVDSLEKLNQKISSDTRLLGKDYQIGHSYVMKLNDKIKGMSLTEYSNYLWSNNLSPLLEEYLRGTAEPGEINNKMNDLKTTFINR